MKKEHLINKRHLEKMEETKTRKSMCPNWWFGTIGHIDRIPKRCDDCGQVLDWSRDNDISR